MFDKLKNNISKENDVAIGSDDFNFEIPKFKVGQTPLWGMQRYLIKEVISNGNGYSYRIQGNIVVKETELS